MRETHVQNTIKNRKLDNTSVEYSPLQGYARNTIKNKNKGLAREEGEEGEEWKYGEEGEEGKEKKPEPELLQGSVGM